MRHNTLKGILTLMALILLTCAAASAQNQTPQGILIQSSPQGALVTLKGGVTVSGVTPARFQQLMVGTYQVEFLKDGYEKYTTRVNIDPRLQSQLSVDLSPKRRWKAAARSLLIPGWGQRYSDKTTKGFAFSVLALGATTAFLIADDNYSGKKDDYDRLLVQYDSLRFHGSLSDLRDLQPRLDQAQSDAYNAETARQITLGGLISIWALNFLDAWLFFPDRRESFTVKGFAVAPEADMHSIGITLSKSF
jgi:hypothetical protein